MTVELDRLEPSWRIKTKPCEYYRKGCCIFGEERCNFLHVMNDWNPDESTIIESKLTKVPSLKFYPETPPSASVKSIISPPRSPRTTNLLLALKGVIRDDEQDQEYTNDLSYEAVDDETDQIDKLDTTANVNQPDSDEPPPSPAHSALLSPVEFSDLQLKHFSLLHSEAQKSIHNPSDPERYESFDAPNSQWVSPPPMVLSPPRSPALGSTFELLASPFGSPLTRLLPNPGIGVSPRLPFIPFIPVSPSPLVSKFDVSDDDIQPDLELDSPTDYYQEKKERDGVQEGEKTAKVHQIPLDDEDEDEDEDGEYTGRLTENWDSEDQDTVRPFFLEPAPPPRSKAKVIPSIGEEQLTVDSQVREDVNEALRQRASSHLNFVQTPETTQQTPAFAPEDVQANSTARVHVNLDDETAQLAYLAENLDEDDSDEVAIPAGEDDTINSLYNVYSDIDSESEPDGEDEEQNDMDDEEQNDMDDEEQNNMDEEQNDMDEEQNDMDDEEQNDIDDEEQNDMDDEEQNDMDDEEQNNIDDEVCISRSLPTHTSPRSQPYPAIPSPPTALPPEYQRNITPPPRTNSKSPPVITKVFALPPASVPTNDDSSSGRSIPIPLPHPGFAASGRRNSNLRPLRLSTIAATLPSFAGSHDRSDSFPNDTRLSIASRHVSPASASDSEFALSNNPLLSSTHSASVYTQQRIQQRYSPMDAITPNPASAPPAVASEQHPLQSPPISAFTAPMIPPPFRRSSIYYIRNERNDQPSNDHSSSQEPKSAPLTRPSTWQESVKSGSVRSVGSSASRRQAEPEQVFGTAGTQNRSSFSDSLRSSSTTSLSVPQPTRAENLSLSRNVSPVLGSLPSPHSNTPRKLLFAIASDNPGEVERVLEHANDSTGTPISANDMIGPQAQSALEFTLENEGLKNKLGIVKKLLGYGADPSKAKLNDDNTSEESELDPATKYYLARADTVTTRRIHALMQRSVFRPLIRLRYGIIGQDRALEQLYRVLSIHSEKISKSPVVVFLCGPSGHGKSMLAHQFGSLLDVPTHTLNMTSLRSADDIWRSYSISSNEGALPCTLVEFLANNEGKRCVVVLDEIEKTERKALWSLLVPWELGRCTFEANSRTIDVRNVIWVGTSNIGNELVLEYHESLQRPEEMLTRDEYVELMGTLRPHVSDQLGASVLSRVSAILPFVPFTTQEKRAIASEFLQESAAEHLVQGLSREQREKVVEDSLKDFVPSEGARSLSRAVSNLLIDSVDF